MNKKAIVIYLYLLIILFPLNLFATAGNNSLSVLANDFDPATSGQADSLIAAADDINSVIINPAGLGHLKWQGLRISHINWLFDLNYENIMVATPLYLGGIGLNFVYFHMNSIEEVSDWKGNSRKLKYYDIITSISYGKDLRLYKGILTFGIGIKYVYEKLGYINGDAFLFDIGAQYRFTLLNYDIMHKSSPNFGIGIVVKNLSQGIKYSDDVWEFVPTILGMGLFYKPFKYYRIEIDFETQRETSYKIKIGNEFYFSKYLIPRLGYTLEEDLHYLSFGLGVFYIMNHYRFTFDYTYKVNPYFGNNNFLGITVYRTGVAGSGIIEKRILIRKEAVDKRTKYPEGVKIGIIDIVNTIIDTITDEYFKLFPSLLNNFLKEMEDRSMTVIDRKRLIEILQASGIKEDEYNSEKALKILSKWIDIDIIIYGYTLILNGEKKLKIELIDVKTLKIVSTDIFTLEYTDELDLIEKVLEKIEIRIKQLTEQ